MAATMYSAPSRMSGRRIIIAIIAAAILLAVAMALYQANQTAEAPSQSTTEMQPDNAANTPPKNDVSQGSNPADDATPDPSGTGGNTILTQ